VNRLLRLLHHLFGDAPPPRPTGHVPHGLHRDEHRRRPGQHGDEREEPADGADDGPAPAPAPPPHHGH
jgi:hypothetical protein